MSRPRERRVVKVFTSKEVAALSRAMEILKGVDALKISRQDGVTVRLPVSVDLINAGRIEEAADRAAESVFNALNTASSHGRDPASVAFFDDQKGAR